MTVKGTLKADALTIARITLDFLQNPIKTHALAGLVDSRTGDTFGWTEVDGGAWSPETRTKIQELRESMERDIAKRVFTSAGIDESNGKGMRVEGGLGEHLGTEDATSI